MGIVDRFKRWTFNRLGGTQTQYITSLGDLNFFLNGSKNRMTVVLETIYNKIANDMSNVTVQHIEKISSENWKLNNNSDLAYVVGFRPNLYQSQADLFYCIAYSLMKYQVAIVLPIYHEGATSKEDIKELQFIPTTAKIKIIDKEVYILNDGVERKVNLEDVIVIRRQPYSLFEDVEIDLSIYTRVLDVYVEAITNQLMNSGKLRGYLSMNTNVKEEAVKKIVKNFVESFSTDNTAGIAGLDNGMEFHELQRTYSKIDDSTQKEIIKEIYKIFGLNESIFVADANEQQYIAYYNSTLEPLLKRIKQEFSAKLITRDMFGAGHRLTMTLPKYDNASLTSFTTYADKMLYHGAANINEIRDELNKPPFEGGDTPRTNANAIELGYQENDKEGGD